MKTFDLIIGFNASGRTVRQFAEGIIEHQRTLSLSKDFKEICTRQIGETVYRFEKPDNYTEKLFDEFFARREKALRK